MAAASSRTDVPVMYKSAPATRIRDTGPVRSSDPQLPGDATTTILAAGNVRFNDLIAPGLTRFHLPGCPAVQGIEARPVDLRSIPSALEPCDLCEADTLAREEEPWISVAG